MKVYFSYLYLHCLKSLIFLAEPYYLLLWKICGNIIHQKYTELSLNLSLNITGHVNLIISGCNKTNSFTEKQDSRIKLCPQLYQPKPKEFMLVILNIISNSKYLQLFYFYSSIQIP